MKTCSVAKLSFWLSLLFVFVAACMTASSVRTAAGASEIPVDRTALPIAESTYLPITELNICRAALN